MDFSTSNFQATVILLIDGWGENAPRWLSMDRIDDKSILVPVMVCCHQASVHHLSQCWPSSMSLYVRYHFNPLHDTLYGVTRPLCTNMIMVFDRRWSHECAPDPLIIMACFQFVNFTVNFEPMHVWSLKELQLPNSKHKLSLCYPRSEFPIFCFSPDQHGNILSHFENIVTLTKNKESADWNAITHHDYTIWRMMRSWQGKTVRIIVLFKGKPPVTGRFPSQRPVRRFLCFLPCLQERVFEF